MPRFWSRLTVAVLALSLALLQAGPAGSEITPEEEALLQEKCSLCHSSKRLYNMDPANMKQVLERMRIKNPDWISNIQSDHIAKIVSTITGDPNVMAARQAWSEALDRGEALFSDKTLGKKGVSCADCHLSKSLHQIADSYPRWNPKLKRFLSLDETISVMLREKIEADIPPSDQRVMDLLIYLKTL